MSLAAPLSDDDIVTQQGASRAGPATARGRGELGLSGGTVSFVLWVQTPNARDADCKVSQLYRSRGSTRVSPRTLAAPSTPPLATALAAATGVGDESLLDLGQPLTSLPGLRAEDTLPELELDLDESVDRAATQQLLDDVDRAQLIRLVEAQRAHLRFTRTLVPSASTSTAQKPGPRSGTTVLTAMEAMGSAAVRPASKSLRPLHTYHSGADNICQMTWLLEEPPVATSRHPEPGRPTSRS